jgi:hypothetical protein|eukprot:COSAG01_NODE_185_length_22691_cov_53.142478_25_plen_76_part_00
MLSSPPGVTAQPLRRLRLPLLFGLFCNSLLGRCHTAAAQAQAPDWHWGAPDVEAVEKVHIVWMNHLCVREGEETQ